MGVKNVKKPKSVKKLSKPSRKQPKYPLDSVLVEWKNNEIYIINTDEAGNATSNKMDRQDVLQIVAHFIEQTIEMVCSETTENK